MSADLDQRKRGLEDDHDPSDLGQKQNNKPKGDFKPPKQPPGRTTATGIGATIHPTAT